MPSFFHFLNELWTPEWPKSVVQNAMRKLCQGSFFHFFVDCNAVMFFSAEPLYNTTHIKRLGCFLNKNGQNRTQIEKDEWLRKMIIFTSKI